MRCTALVLDGLCWKLTHADPWRTGRFLEGEGAVKSGDAFLCIVCTSSFLLLMSLVAVYYLKLKHARDMRLKVENCLKCNGDQRRCTECPGPSFV